MSKSLEVFKIEERIKVSFLKSGGNILEVMNELNLPQEYIKKVVEKLKKKEARDVSVLISDTLASHILMGHESRKIHYQQSLKELETSGKTKLSVCCEVPVIRLTDSADYGHEDYECSLCHERCSVKENTHNDVYRIKKEILEQLREEDRLLLEFAEKMGYTNVPKEPAVRVNQNFVVMNSNEDQKIIKEISSLNPKDRDKLLDRLEEEIIDDNEQEPKSKVV